MACNNIGTCSDRARACPLDVMFGIGSQAFGRTMGIMFLAKWRNGRSYLRPVIGSRIKVVQPDDVWDVQSVAKMCVYELGL